MRLLQRIIGQRKMTTENREPTKSDCSTCIYYDLALGIKPVCKLWLVGFDKRGYEPCDEYKAVKEK